MNAHATAYRNVILRNLTPAAVQRLGLMRVKLPIEREIEYPEKQIKHLLFLEDGLASMTNTFIDGTEAEIGVAGYESVLGASALLGTDRSLNRVYMQIEGWGYSTHMEAARQEFDRHGEFMRLVLRYTQAQFIQSSQTAGCNAHHAVQQRLARWLLLCDDRLKGKQLTLSQQFISQMLGVQRTSVSTEANKLQKKGLIRYSRGRLDILDRAGLQEISCECYEAVRKHLQFYEDVGGKGLGS